MGMLRTEKTPRQVDGIFAEPSAELLDSFYTPSDEDKERAHEQIKKLEAHIESQKPPSPPPSPSRDSRYFNHPKYHMHPKLHFQHPKFGLPRFFKEAELPTPPPMPARKAQPSPRLQRLLACYRSILAPVRRVPDEIWQAIFTELFQMCDLSPQILPAYTGSVFQHEAAYMPNSFRQSLLTVCKRWRSILLRIPSAWSPITLTYAAKGTQNPVDTRSAAYLEWISNWTPDFPLSIDIKPDINPSDTPFYTAGPIPRQLLQIAESTSSRWGHLKLLVLHAPVVWNAQNGLPSQLPSLHYLNLDFAHLEVYEEEAIAALPSAPALTHLTISNLINIWKMPDAASKYPSITHLSTTLGFQQPASRFEVAFIASLPNLTHFHFNGTLRWLETANHPPPLLFSQVQVLSLDSTDDPMGYILGRMTMPSLHTMKLRIKLQLATPEPHHQNFTTQLSSFLVRSECKIKRLTLVDVHHSCFGRILVNAAFDSVERMECWMPRHMFDQTTKMVNGMVRRLVWDPDAEEKERKLVQEKRRQRERDRQRDRERRRERRRERAAKNGEVDHGEEEEEEEEEEVREEAAEAISGCLLPELRFLQLSFREDERFRNTEYNAPSVDLDIAGIIAVVESRALPPREGVTVSPERLEELSMRLCDHRKFTPLDMLRLTDVGLRAQEQTGKSFRLRVKQGGKEMHDLMKQEEAMPW